jgi:Ni/Fe-hydrogenase subunit HybB-like protein
MIGLPVLAFIKGWMVINAWYNPASWEAYRLITSSPNFYIFEIGLLLLVPFLLATFAYYKKNLAMALLAAVLVVVAGFVDKYNLIIEPQVAYIYSLGVGSIHYAPAPPDIKIAIGSVLVYAALLVLGVLLLPLKPGERPKTLYIFK